MLYFGEVGPTQQNRSVIVPFCFVFSFLGIVWKFIWLFLKLILKMKFRLVRLFDDKRLFVGVKLV